MYAASLLMTATLLTPAADVSTPPPLPENKFPTLAEPVLLSPVAESLAGEASSARIADATFKDVQQDDFAGLIAIGSVDAPNAYAEMWMLAADGRRYFSRQPLPSGGSATTPKVVVTPMHLSGDGGAIGAEFNIVLPEGGRVEVGGVRVISVPDGVASLSLTDNGRLPWSFPISAGAIVGVLGAVFGTLLSFARRRRETGRGPAWLLRVPIAGLVAGIMMLAAGVFAAITGQPWGVWYSFALGGAIFTAICVIEIWQTRRGGSAHQTFETRRMQAFDV